MKNTGIDDSLVHGVIDQGKAFFALPEEKKLEIEMKNKPSFLGISSCAALRFCSGSAHNVRNKATTNSATR